MPNTFGRGVQRFIPAGAGNTRRYPPGSSASAVHPRWRGEHLMECAACNGGAGSSPLARGTLPEVVEQEPPVRFIPAGAGNTPPCASASSASAVHPRWRGEHISHTRRCALYVGSSPLARGTHLHPGIVSPVPRFIPAGAGNTCPQLSGEWWQAVHPRWRGEHG